MKRNTFLGFIILSFAFLICSCSKSDDTENSSSSSSILLKRVVDTTGGGVTLTYIGNKLDKMILDDGGVVVFTYTGDLITKQETFENNILIYHYTYTYSNNKLFQVRFYEKNKLNQLSEYVYSDGVMEVKHSSYQNNGSIYYDTRKYYFEAKGNVVKEEEYHYSTKTLASTRDYIYDDKNNPFKNVTGLSILVKEFTPNNVITEIMKIPESSNVWQTTNSYQYNSQGYPTSCITTSSTGQAYTTTYFYD